MVKKEKVWSKNVRKNQLEDRSKRPFPSKKGRRDLLRENPAFSNRGPFRRLNVV
jgi:hypothetical protein